VSGYRGACLVGALGVVALWCGQRDAPLPPGSALGAYADLDAPESYVGQELFAYMNGGAELFHEYGFRAAWVRRYARGSTHLVAELFEMKDSESAAALYSHMRRPEGEREIAPGCLGSLSDSGVRMARGSHYLACRNEDPMAEGGGEASALCAQLAGRLTGECGVGRAFAGVPEAGRVRGTEMALRGPIGLNVRPWLSPLEREGFESGWLASFAVGGGTAEVLLGRYTRAASAEQGARSLTSADARGVAALARDRRLAAARGAEVNPEELRRLCERVLTESR
jgi:hypothetical protein